MGKRLLRSVLVAAFSAALALGAISGISGEKTGVRADTSWPGIVKSVKTASDTSWPVAPTDAVSGS